MDMTALYKLSCGLYVITTVDGGRGVGCVVNTVTQVTAEPVQVMVAINKENFTAGAVQRAGRFAVSVLTESAPMELIGRFGFRSSRDEDKFEGLKAVEFKALPCPAEHVNAVLVCRVKETVDAGSHLLFIAEVEDAETLSKEPSMTYAYYHQVKNGLTPPKASSYQAAAPAPAAVTRWQCSVCGYIYEGEELPAGFTCPVCKQGAEVFKKL